MYIAVESVKCFNSVNTCRASFSESKNVLRILPKERKLVLCQGLRIDV